jgi:putative membrane protein
MMRVMIRLAKQLTLSWVANAIVLAVVTVVLSGVKSDTVGDLIRAALLFGILNTILKPVLRLLTLPLAFITLGLIWFGVAMVMLWLTSIFIDGFSIHGFWTYVWATVIVWVVNVVLDFVPGPWRETRRD